MKLAYQTILLSLAALFAEALGSSSTGQTTKGSSVIFRGAPMKHLFKRGEEVVFAFSIKNNSTDPVFVSRLRGNEFVDMKLIGPDGEEVPWQGTGRIDSKAYSVEDFAVLKPGESLRAFRTISFKDGRGFVFEKSGRYSVTAEYSMGPPGYFAPLAGKAKIPSGSFSSPPSTFCIHSCDSDSDK